MRQVSVPKSSSLAAQATGGRSPFGIAEFVAFWWRDVTRRLMLASLLCVVWLSFFGAQWFRVKLVVSGAKHTLGVDAETSYLPPGPVLRLVSLGHQSFLADLTYLRACHYFVRHMISDAQLPWLERYLEAIWALDAHDQSTYRWGSQVVKFGQRNDREVAQRANRIARIGLEIDKDDAWLYSEIAFNLHYGMEPKSPEELRYYKDLSLRYLQIAYSFPNFAEDPNYLAAQYARAGNVADSVKSALVNYATATENERRELRNMLAERNHVADAAELAWLDATHQRDWSYLPPTLSIMVGPKRIAAPPLETTDPMQWYRAPAISRELADKIGALYVQAPPGERPGNAEWTSELPAVSTLTTATK